MPKLRRTAKTRSDKLTPAQEDSLTGLCEWPDAFSSPLERHALWMQHGAALMEEAGVDCRPQGYWDYGAPREPRRVVARRGAAPLYGIFPDDPEHAHLQPVFESDIPYLARLGLATPLELAYLDELRAENAVADERVRQHPDALGATTLRTVDYVAAGIMEKGRSERSQENRRRSQER